MEKGQLTIRIRVDLVAVRFLAIGLLLIAVVIQLLVFRWKKWL